MVDGKEIQFVLQLSAILRLQNKYADCIQNNPTIFVLLVSYTVYQLECFLSIACLYEIWLYLAAVPYGDGFDEMYSALVPEG